MKNVADTGVGGGKHAGLLSSLQGRGKIRPTIRVGEVGPYSQYGPYHWGLPPQSGPSSDISK